MHGATIKIYYTGYSSVTEWNKNMLIIFGFAISIALIMKEIM